MNCPFCAHPKDKVVDSREANGGEAIRRRRECLSCGKRFTSYERIEEIPYLVIKKDGQREAFERSKLVAGLHSACEKRPVSAKAIEEIGERWTIPCSFTSLAITVRAPKAASSECTTK